MAHLKVNTKSQSGFTIVELLIVIVVIGILAAITIVAYSGITARANTTKAQTNAANAQKVAEAYNADASYYPALATAFAAGFGATPSSKLPSGITVVPQSTALTTTNGATTVTWACLTTCTTTTGGRITYFDFTTGIASTTIIYVGAATVAGTFVNPTS